MATPYAVSGSALAEVWNISDEELASQEFTDLSTIQDTGEPYHFVFPNTYTEDHMEIEAEPFRGRNTSKTAPLRNRSTESFTSNISCRSCSATFTRPDVRKRHEDEKHSTTTRKVTCGGAWLGWGCGKEYANERSLKDHWVRQAKDGTGKSCKAAKESVYASFPPKNDLTSRSSSQDVIMWDEHGNMNGEHTTEPAQSQSQPPVTRARSSTLLSNRIQSVQTRASKVGPALPSILPSQATNEPSIPRRRREHRLKEHWDKMLQELQYAAPPLRESMQSSIAIIVGTLAYIKKIKADQANLERRLENEIDSLQNRINALTSENDSYQSRLNMQSPTPSSPG